MGHRAESKTPVSSPQLQMFTVVIGYPWFVRKMQETTYSLGPNFQGPQKRSELRP